MTAWPEVDCVAILCTEDRVISPNWSRRAARRLGVRAREVELRLPRMSGRP